MEREKQTREETAGKESGTSERSAGKRVGITTTLPVEIILAAGCVPVDLNNRFIASEDPGALVDRAEARGLPAGVCAWIKGIYAVVMKEDIPLTVCVTGGDCSNTIALMELLQHEDCGVASFEFPYDRNENRLRIQMEQLALKLGTDLNAATVVFERLRPLRRKLVELDSLTWERGRVTGAENHSWLVGASDFHGDPSAFEDRLDAFLLEARTREPESFDIRLALAGVPPIITGLHDYVEERGARIMLNETQRAFSLPWEAKDILSAYRNYTYPYSVFHRFDDFALELEKREIDAVIHYVQHACHRHLADPILRDRCHLPVLTIEADRPGSLSSQHSTRIDAFLEMVRGA